MSRLSDPIRRAQVKKCLDVTHKLGGQNFVMWGGRDGYQTLLNTDYKKENDIYASFLRMTADYADSIGFKGQLLLEPKPRASPVLYRPAVTPATTIPSTTWRHLGPAVTSPHRSPPPQSPASPNPQ